jgi:hypothetical protein
LGLGLGQSRLDSRRGTGDGGGARRAPEVEELGMAAAAAEAGGSGWMVVRTQVRKRNARGACLAGLGFLFTHPISFYFSN